MTSRFTLTTLMNAAPTAAQELAMAAFALSATFIIAAGIASFRYFSDGIIHDAQVNLQGIGALKSERIEALLHERFLDTRIFANRPALQRVLGGALQKEALKDELARVAGAIDLTIQAYGYKEILVVDTGLKVISPLATAELQPRERLAIEAAIRTRQHVLADFHTGPEGEPDYGIAQPVFLGDERDAPVVGAVFFERSGRMNLFPLLNDWPTSSATGETVLLRKEEEQAVFINPPKFHPSARALSIRRPMSETQYIGVEALATGDGLVSGVDNRGVKVIGAASRVGGTPWVILSKMDLEEVERPIRTLAIVTASLVALLLAAAGAIAWLLWRWKIQALATDRLAIAERYATAARTSIDGYLVTDGDNTIVEVNPSVIRLSGYSERELLAMTVRDLEAIESPEEIAARTKDLLETGSGQFPGKWKRKDGALIDLEISVSHLKEAGADRFHAFVRDVTKRKAAEASVERLLREQSAVLNSEVVGIVKLRDRVMTWCNPTFERMLGYQEGELIGQSTRIIYTDDDAYATIGDAAYPIIDGGGVFRKECQYVRKDGSLGWFDISGARRHPDTKESIWSFIDITDGRLAEDELRLSEARLRAAMQATSQGWFDLDIRSGRVTASTELSRILHDQKRVAAMSLQSWVDSIHHEDREAVLDVYREALQTGESRTMEYRLLTADGRWKWIRSVAKVVEYGPAGKPLRMIGTHADVTDRKRTEEALRESKNQFKTVVEFGPLCMALVRPDGVVEYINRKAIETFGFLPQDVPNIDRWWVQAYPDEIYRAEVIAQWTRLAEDARAYNREIERREYRVTCKDGSVKIVVIFGVWIADTLLVIFDDITERKAAEAERERLEAMRLNSQRLESLGTLAGGIAHDFNNILAAIRGNADLAAEDARGNSAAAESIAEIRKASERATELVRRIMRFGQPKEPLPQVLDLSVVVEEVLKLLRSTLPAGIALRTRFARGVSPVLADAAQVHEVVVNLTTNAVYAIGPRPGWIEYGLENVEIDATIAACLNVPEGRYSRLTVEDSGRGMDEAIKTRIFDAFFTTKPPGEGTGLGLSMVHGIVRSHGGAISVDSAPGKGACFQLYFPVSRNAAREPGKLVPPATLLAGQRVMYVDDEEALAYLARRVLGRLGHSVAEFTDPKEALKAFRSDPQRYDVVVTDLSMPEMSGFDLTRQIRAIRPDIPILMTTGYIRAEDQSTAYEAGVSKLILKPVGGNELASVLDTFLKQTMAT